MLTLQTRGVQKEIRVDARQTRITINGDVTTVPTPAKHWQRLTGLLATMTLADLATLPASTHRQASDAALAAQIQVVTSKKTYESVSYDHPNAPDVMLPLTSAVVEGVPKKWRTEFQ